MKRTVVIQSGTAGDGRAVKGNGQEGEGSEWPRLGYHAGMVLLLCGFLALGLGGITVALLAKVPALRAHWWDMVVVDVVAVCAVGGWYGVKWMREAATRSWRVTDEERYRRWGREDAALEGEEEAEDEEPRSEGWKLELAGYRILALHYVEGLSCTRPECEEQGIGQGDWNEVNKVLVGLGIKKERKWVEGVDFREALRRWNEDAWFEADGRVRVRVGKGSWQGLEGTRSVPLRGENGETDKVKVKVNNRSVK